MPSWLKAAKDALGRLSDQPSQTFTVHCGCGRTLTGLRTTRAQTAICPDCRTGVFVLPASVYPLPASARPAAAKSRPRKVAVADDSASPEPDPTSQPADKSAARPTTKHRLTANESGPRPRPAPQRDVPAPSAVFKPVVRRPVITPLRLVLTGVLLVLGTTGGWLIHLRTLAQAEEVLRVIPKVADELLEEGDLNEAALKFGAVMAALDTLGRDNPPARRLRQNAREVTATAGASSTTLHDILNEAAAAVSTGSSASWTSAFRSLYRSDWVVFDVPVKRASSAANNSRYVILLPVVSGQSQARIVGELAFFEQLVPDDGRPHRVIFAAQLDDFVPDSTDENSWTIILDSATAFLWSGNENLVRLGYTMDDSTRHVLANQTRDLGLEP